MPRRRPFRRRPLGRRRPLPPRVRQALVRANSLMACGQLAEAADVERAPSALACTLGIERSCASAFLDRGLRVGARSLVFLLPSVLH